MAYLGAVVLVWGLYLRVMYQVVRIAPAPGYGQVNLRALPALGVVVLALLLALLIFILVTGPQSNVHLLPG
jgi:hypothetical protein